MRKTRKAFFFGAIAACFLVLVLTGCPANTPTPTPPVAPGYNNPADQTMGEILAASRSFYISIQQQSVAGTIVLTPTVKAAFNDFGVALNAAETVYLAYHGNPTATNFAAAQAAVNTVQSKQATLPLPGAKP